jgi:hypothetical protein
MKFRGPLYLIEFVDLVPFLSRSNCTNPVLNVFNTLSFIFAVGRSPILAKALTKEIANKHNKKFS